MFEKIKIAQAQENGDIIGKLEADDQKMVELNSSLLNILDEYQTLNFSQSSQTFFSFNNPYFWALLIGLLLLALALGTLMKELKKGSSSSPALPKMTDTAKTVVPPLTTNTAPVQASKEQSAVKASQRAAKKSLKIKVVKVKK
ncbi:MAG: hypothetical protein PHO91_03560 [Patescibacteria group bacterium]|nr:hypothetical protein [Patescibacteria group bacterium]